MRCRGVSVGCDDLHLRMPFRRMVQELVERVRRVDRVVLFRSIFAGVLQNDLRATRVLGEELGEELGEIDPGRGDHTAAVTIDLPQFDPRKGVFDLKEDGRFGFRWNWHLYEDNMTREDVDALQPHLEDIGPYEIEWNPEEEEFENDDTFYLSDLTEEEFHNLETAIRDVADYIRTELVNAEA